MSFELRPVEPRDRQALTRLIRIAGERGELDGYHPVWTDSTVDFLLTKPDWSTVATDGDSLVGFVSPEPKWLVVDPDARRRGIGRRLVEAGAAIERARGRPNLLAAPVAGNEAAFAFLGACGFRHHSTVWEFELDRDVDVPLPTLPPDVRLRTYVPGQDDATLLATFNAAFASHPTPLVFDQEILDMSKRDPEFDPSQTILLVLTDAPETAVGLCAVSVVREEGRAVSGDIGWVGVLPEAQGRGYGRELLRWGIHELRRLAVSKLTLSVNAANERALQLYERSGFHRVAERPRWALPTA